MRLFSPILLALSLLCVFCPAKESSLHAFDRQISFEQAGEPCSLQLTGVATRKKFFVKVYRVAHYLQDAREIRGSHKPAAILASNKTKQLSFKWERAVDGKTIQEGYRDAFRDVLSKEERNHYREQVERYIDFFKRGTQKGDRHTIRWLLNGDVELFINEKKMGSISGDGFARAMWRIWFGSDNVVSRSDLVSELD